MEYHHLEITDRFAFWNDKVEKARADEKIELSLLFEALRGMFVLNATFANVWTKRPTPTPRKTTRMLSSGKTVTKCSVWTCTLQLKAAKPRVKTAKRS